VPETLSVDSSKFSPFGKAGVTDQVKGARPPERCTVLPTSVSANDVVMIVRIALTVIERVCVPD
jgi:hypothetical protein